MPQIRISTPRGRRTPVLLVNGFSFFPLVGLPTKECRNVYRKQGRAVRKVPWSVENMIDIATYAASVRSHVLWVLEKTGHQKINLIGWSMGGIAGLYALKRMGLHCLVDNFVCFGSPFNGTDISYPGVLTGLYALTAMQLMPGSSFLRDLNAGPLPGEPNYVSISGDMDFLCPPSRAVLQGADNITSSYGHESFLMSVSLHRLIADQLK